jgi:peptidoglycan/xylan/chitin deacetylase (PgdA/CDA1 family)
MLPRELLNTRNLFLYFDYEREFGGHNTEITNREIEKIVNLLSAYGIPTSWFTVGKVFQKYPESIHLLQNHGHEVGSHSFGHLAPVFTPYNKLKIDFKKFRTTNQNNIPIKGYHAPKGQWSWSMLKLMKKFNLIYDVAGISEKYPQIPLLIGKNATKQIYRLQTLGDDWPLYKLKPSSRDVYLYFMRMVDQIKTGQLGGIGFHPWVIYSNTNIFDGFKRFIEELKNQQHLQIHTASKFIELIKNSNA